MVRSCNGNELGADSFYQPSYHSNPGLYKHNDVSDLGYDSTIPRSPRDDFSP